MLYRKIYPIKYCQVHSSFSWKGVRRDACFDGVCCCLGDKDLGGGGVTLAMIGNSGVGRDYFSEIKRTFM
jgi:hypothetical protein